MTRRRCAYRPGCLAWLRPDDDIVDTSSGPALADHAEAVENVVDLDLDEQSVAS